MLNLAELEQFVAFAELGTLSRAAEQLHISQPTITRTMRHVEDAFGVSLFQRGKNRIELNETGKLAAEYARKLLFEAEKTTQAIRAFDRSLRTITVHSCAPAPLWSLLPSLSQKHSENTVSSKIMDIEGIIQDVLSGQCDIGILPFPCQNEGLMSFPYIRKDCLSAFQGAVSWRGNPKCLSSSSMASTVCCGMKSASGRISAARKCPRPGF